MPDTQSETESLLDIVRGIDNRTIMLPEFQRDFRWELEQTYDLFDSLIREIFIGTIDDLSSRDRRLRRDERGTAAFH
ncbi:MAG: DUF262 domain-containing protein [Chloroflexales bacterium]